jgi:hypothetical protein
MARQKYLTRIMASNTFHPNIGIERSFFLIFKTIGETGPFTTILKSRHRISLRFFQTYLEVVKPKVHQLSI